MGGDSLKKYDITKHDKIITNYRKHSDIVLKKSSFSCIVSVRLFHGIFRVYQHPSFINHQ